MALILSRKPGESLMIETPLGPVIVTVTKVRGNTIKLGIDADPSIRVLRGELVEKPVSSDV